MWFSLFSTVLVLAITFYQGLQGLFSGLINCILAVLSAAVAFGFHENLYVAFLQDRQPDYGRAVALVGIFVVTLLILRTIFDALIQGNVHFQLYVDRAGGGLFGLITAMIIVGTLTIGFQMLPFPPDFMGFSRYTVRNADNQEVAWVSSDKDKRYPLGDQDWSTLKVARNRTWLNPGGFTTSLVSVLSSNALRGRDDVTFAELYPDYLAYIFNAKANPLGPSRLTAESDALRVLGHWTAGKTDVMVRQRVTQNDKKTIKLKRAEPAESGMRYFVVRVALDKGKDEGGDVIRFTPSQVRLIAREKAGKPLKEYILAAISEEAPAAKGALVQVYSFEGIARQEKPNNEMDFAFLVPDDKEFKPEFLEFKMNTRVEVTPQQDWSDKPRTPPGVKPPKGGTAPRPSNTGNGGGNTDSTGSGGRTGSGIRPTADGELPKTQGRVAVLGPARVVVVDDKLPFDKPLTNYGGGEVEVSGGTLKGAHDVVAPLDADFNPTDGTNQPIERFEAPDGKRVVQVSVPRLMAGSTLGKALSFARENVGDFYLKADGGKEFRPVGVFAMADVSGEKVFEMTYLNDLERDNARIPKFKKIKGADLTGTYALVYIFHVPPGTKPTEVHTGGQPVDLRAMKITVP